MELVTKKSECRGATRSDLVKSPKDAMRKTGKNNLTKEALVVKLFPATFVGSNGKPSRNLWG